MPQAYGYKDDSGFRAEFNELARKVMYYAPGAFIGGFGSKDSRGIPESYGTYCNLVAALDSSDTGQKYLGPCQGWKGPFGFDTHTLIG